jgi:hypothetical protein
MGDKYLDILIDQVPGLRSILEEQWRAGAEAGWYTGWTAGTQDTREHSGKQPNPYTKERWGK